MVSLSSASFRSGVEHSSVQCDGSCQFTAGYSLCFQRSQLPPGNDRGTRVVQEPGLQNSPVHVPGCFLLCTFRGRCECVFFSEAGEYTVLVHPLYSLFKWASGQ